MTGVFRRRMVARVIVPAFLALIATPVWGADQSRPRAASDNESTPGERLPMQTQFFVSPDGCDGWSGTRPEANQARADGPFRTVARAQQAVRALTSQGPLAGPVTVTLRGGDYFLDAPLVFTSLDSGTPEQAEWDRVDAPEYPVTYAAFPGERPVVSGGVRLTGWEVGELRGHTVWKKELPEVASETWDFHQLFVNGSRRPRPRLPKEGFYHIAELIDARYEGDWQETVGHGSDRFHYREGDLQRWHNLPEVDVTVLTLWMSLHAKLGELDERTHLAVLDRNSGTRMSDDFERSGARYFVENVFEALDTPGQWYLDRPAGLLYYLPLPGETPECTEVIAPRLSELIRLEGDSPESPVRSLRFEGLTFAHTEWALPSGHASYGQGAALVPGAATASNASNCRIDQCTFEHLAGFAVALESGCRDLVVSHSTMRDLGAGGVKIWQGCTRNTIADCDIGPVSRVFLGADGILVGNASGNQILHNHLHDIGHVGISLGWTWGYAESNCYGNIVEDNHVHDIGHRGLLSDLAGIYTLGVQPGTRVRRNVVHGVHRRNYGGWGIYLDEGSSGILVEQNLVYDTQDAGFRQTSGRDNVVRNNVLVVGEIGAPRSGDSAAVARMMGELHRSFTFEHNIVSGRGGELVGQAGWREAGVESGIRWSADNASFHDNLYFAGDAAEAGPLFSGRSFAEWRALGLDEGSRIADPQFRDPEHLDFRLRRGSPALKMGFQDFDLADVGPRPRKP